VVIYRLTKYSHFIVLNHSYIVTTVAQAFLDHVYKLYGLPINIVSDRDPIFTSRFWKKLMTKLDVQLNMSTTFHPQTDGQIKNFNQCLEPYLRVMVYDKNSKWTNYLSLTKWWYNTN
jgi:transposase InsO family protein